MVITMVLTNRPKIQLRTDTQRIYKVITVVITAALLFSAQLAYADTKVQPKLSAHSYAYWYQDEQVNLGTDRGLALLLNPELRVTRVGPNVQTSLYWQDEVVWYHDDQRSQQSGQTYKATNVISVFNQRISWGLNAAGGYQVRDSRQGVYADIITSPDNLAKTKSYGTDLNFTTLSGAPTQANLLLSYKVYSADGSITGENDSYSNDNYRGVLNLGSANRTGVFFWNLSGNYNQTERDSYDDFESSRANATLGLPIYSHLSFLLRASYEKNKGATNYINEFSSYGAGAELKLGRASWINVTWNKSRLNNEAINLLNSDSQDDEYVATELFLAPSRRTSLAFNYDKRYFGRTMTLQGHYNLRFITVRLAASDTIRTESQLAQEFEDLGIFVCPNGSTNLADCFRPPTNNYLPGVGESFQQFGQFNSELSERIILSRNVLLGVGYTKNKLTLNVSASTGEDKYVETQRLTRRHTLSMQALWKIYSDLDANFEASFYRLNYTADNRIDNNMSANVGLNYRLSKQTELKADMRHIRRDSSLANADISETRLGLGLSYAF